MPDSRPSAESDELALELVFSTMQPLTAAEVKSRLVRLQEAHGPVLTDEEYQEWRSSILDAVVAPSQQHLVQLVTYCAFLLAATAGTTYGIISRNDGFTFSGAVVLVVCLLQVGRHLHSRRSESRLGLSNRLAVVEELRSSSLITDEEYQQLRGRIEERLLGKPSA